MDFIKELRINKNNYRNHCINISEIDKNIMDFIKESRINPNYLNNEHNINSKSSSYN